MCVITIRLQRCSNPWRQQAAYQTSADSISCQLTATSRSRCVWSTRVTSEGADRCADCAKKTARCSRPPTVRQSTRLLDTEITQAGISLSHDCPRRSTTKMCRHLTTEHNKGLGGLGSTGSDKIKSKFLRLCPL